ncbi:hypothetical protein [Sinorhizobium glycinis]|uniref:hypothetical protein n=1 Tax=Sinorhizobium glycinis TaxID=1472378 RepID=UPI000AEA21D8|nr:hypothetical protein [Sinorhizobium glycinis]
MTVLTKDLSRTYKNTDFADKVIDHITVPAAQAALFAAPKVASLRSLPHFHRMGCRSLIDRRNIDAVYQARLTCNIRLPPIEKSADNDDEATG